jgi:hypothetical protein
MLTCEAGG